MDAVRVVFGVCLLATVHCFGSDGDINKIHDEIKFPEKLGQDVDSYNAAFSAAGKGIKNVSQGAQDYPSDQIHKTIPDMKSSPTVSYFDKSGNDMDSLCATLRYSKVPKTMKNLEGIEKYIILNPDGYKQAVFIERCLKSNQTCSAVIFPPSYKSRCVQKYSTVPLYALEGGGSGRASYDMFEIPSCCVCMVANTNKMY